MRSYESALPKKLWFAPRADQNYYPYIFIKKPALIKREDGLYVFDLLSNKEVKILWCREYRKRKQKPSSKGRT